MSTTNPYPRLARSPRPALVALTLAYFVMGTGSLSVIGLLPLMASDLQVSNAAIAQLFAAFSITFALVAPVVPRLARTFPKRILLGGLGVFAVGATLTAVAQTYLSAFGARILLALGAAAIGPISSWLAAHLVRREMQGRALAFINSGMALAAILGVPLTAWIGSHVGWRWAFASLAAAALVAIGAVALGLSTTGLPKRTRSPSLYTLIANRAAIFAFGVTAFHTAAQFATYALAAPYLAERFGVPEYDIPLALLLFGIGSLFGNILAGALADAVGAQKSVKIALGALAVVLVWLLVAPHNESAGIASLFLLAVAALLFQAPQQKLLVQLDPSASPLVLAANASAAYVGMALGAATASLASEFIVLSWLPACSLAILAISTTCFAIAIRALPSKRLTITSED